MNVYWSQNFYDRFLSFSYCKIRWNILANAFNKQQQQQQQRFIHLIFCMRVNLGKKDSDVNGWVLVAWNNHKGYTSQAIRVLF